MKPNEPDAEQAKKAVAEVVELAPLVDDGTELVAATTPVIDALLAGGGPLLEWQLRQRAKSATGKRKRRRWIRQANEMRACVTQARQRIAQRRRERQAEMLQKLKDDYLELETEQKYVFRQREGGDQDEQ